MDTQKDIKILDFDINEYNQKLFNNSELVLSYGKKYSLIGKNGIGKSTLLKYLYLRKLPFPSHLSVLYVEQLMDANDINDIKAIDYVLSSNKNRTELLYKIHQLEVSNDLGEQYIELCNKLYGLGYEKDESTAIKILHGLGVSNHNDKLSQFSGGWKTRISLAKCLYICPDLLLLDEPTNNLDLNAVIWLGNYICKYKKTVLSVSHNIQFINKISDFIINIENGKCIRYNGKYDNFKYIHNQKQIALEKEWNKYLKNKKSFVTPPPKPQTYNPRIPNFEPKILNGDLIALEKVGFNYGQKVIFNNINFIVSQQTRMAIIGPNGVGKSTLLKLLNGNIKPTSGVINKHNVLRIGYYSQDVVESRDLSVLDYLKETGEQNVQRLRAILGSLGLSGAQHIKKINELSGGQCSRVALAYIILKDPHILLLDEPTNHLDLETINTLTTYLNEFKGGIIMVSHDMDFISALNLKTWLIKNMNLFKFDDDYETYVLNTF